MNSIAEISKSNCIDDIDNLCLEINSGTYIFIYKYIYI